MMNQYETVFIMTPVLSDEQMKEAVKKYQDFLKEKGAEIVHEEAWGLRKLAYPIQKKSSGFYHLIEYKDNGEVIRDFEVAFKRDERILRLPTTRKNVEWQKRKKLRKQNNFKPLNF
jgi:small subunit ribosomal protein S6